MSHPPPEVAEKRKPRGDGAAPVKHLNVSQLTTLSLAPHSIDAEQSVLGALLLDNAALEKIRDVIAERDFYRDDHRRIFRHIASLIGCGQPADVVTVDEAIKVSDDKDKTGGMTYLAALAGNTPSAHNVRRYAEIVAEHARRRNVQAEAMRLHDAAARGDLDQLCQGAAENIARAGGADLSRFKRRRDFGAVHFDEIEMPAAPTWIIKGLFAPGQVIVIYGPPGEGKTYITIDMLLHAARGMPWRGRRTSTLRGLVVFVAAEAGGSILPRLLGWRSKHMSEAAEDETPFVVLTIGPNLLDGAQVGALIAKLAELSRRTGLPVSIVCFDTLSRSMHGGDENGSEDMGKVISAADQIRDELGAAVIFVHHSGKDLTKGARGHTSLNGAADVVLAIADQTITVEKVRDGIAGEKLSFKLEPFELGRDADGDPIMACTVAHLTEPQASGVRREAKLPGVARIALQALQEAIDEHGTRLPETSSIPPGVTGVQLEQWRTRFALRYGSGGKDGKRDDEAVGRAFRRGKERLQGDPQRVAVSEPYCWLCK